VAEVRAEMVANVWKVVAAEGAQVSDGDTLVILESMKMEIPVLAEGSGTLTRLHVAEGDVGKVIGRQGRIARALRTVVRAGGPHAGRRLQLDIVG